MKSILVLCTGNSAPSQMGEGLYRHEGRGTYEVASAGTKPSFVRATMPATSVPCFPRARNAFTGASKTPRLSRVASRSGWLHSGAFAIKSRVKAFFRGQSLKTDPF
jgi:hypothetical protein